MKLFKPKAPRGDTIVEVLIGIVLLGAAIGLATVSANHNYQVGVDSVERDRANNLAQSQIEFIRNAYNANKLSGSTEINNYKKIEAFCIKQDGITDNLSNPTTKCTEFDNGELTVAVYWEGAPSNSKCENGDGSPPAKTFSINVCWLTAANGSGHGNLTLYYKLP